MTDQDLMLRIQRQWGPLILDVLSGSPIPPNFLAALIANESNGLAGSTRVEPEVFGVLRGKHPDWTLERLRDNATSWGLTQIMGENYPGPPVELADPQTNLTQAIKMIGDFAYRWRLDMTSDFEGLFRCWNTGNPKGQTYDPNYVSKGLARMQLYPAS